MNSIQLFYNFFTGPLPSFIDLPLLTDIDMVVNYLSGTLSDGICNSTHLTSIKFNQNMLSGSLPYCLGRLNLLTVVHINSNSVTGTLPMMYLNDTLPGEFEVAINMLTGSIPDSLCEFYPQNLDLSNNSFTGTIPNCLTETVLLNYLSLAYNIFSGTFPSKFLNSTILNTITVASNKLTGTLPDISRMPSLEFFYVQNNNFHGPLNLHLNSSRLELSFLDVSNNQFTGSLPADLFQDTLPLLSFAAGSNCFTGNIPEELCNLKQLVFLDLDGLSTAEACRIPLFTNIHLIKSFSLKNQITGGIPSCLFNMSTLNTLHLSGNSIDWSFPERLEINDALQTLSLSHNKLTGTIPTVIQEKVWTALDLSYNKLTGMIMSNWTFSNDASLILEVNRLSGGIPSSLHDLPSINILSGNLFGCNFDRTSLPKHDNSYHIYQCGSNSFYQASIIWGVCVACVGMLLVLIYRWSSVVALFSSLRSCFAEYLAVFDETNGSASLAQFKSHLLLFRDSVIAITVALLIVCLTVYVMLTVYYKTNDHQYAWTVSAGFISGQLPAMVLLALYIVLIACLFFLWVLLNSFFKISSDEDKKSRPINISQGFVLSILVFANCVFMVLVNFGYVEIILNYSEVVIFFTQISMALFKLLWNDFCIRAMISVARRYYKKEIKEDHEKMSIVSASENEDTMYIGQEMPFATFIILFNCIIAPCLATAAVDRDCFYDAFVAAQPVKSEFPIYDCDILLVDANDCTKYDAIVSYIDVSYSPPFIYSYQCSSSILTNYAAVFVFMFLMVAFFKLVVLAVMVTYRSQVAEGSMLHFLMDNTIYKLLKPARVEDLQNNAVVFYKDRFVLRMISKISVLVTFGVVFPPLAAVVCVAFFTETYLSLIMIGRFLSSLEESEMRVQFRDLVCRNVEGFEKLLLMPIVSLVVPFAALFYGFFVFDTYGDEVGFKMAVWAPATVAAVPLFLWVCYRIFRLVSGNDDLSRDEKKKEELVRMSQQRDSVVVNALYSDSVM